MAKPESKVDPVKKPIVKGGWHGPSAMKMALRRALSILIISILFLIGTMMLSFTALWARILVLVMLVGIAAYYEYIVGANAGERDCAWGEALWSRREKGESLSAEECDRSFHPLKGFFAVLIGALPFLLVCIMLAVCAERVNYSLGTLPSWTEGLMSQSEFADGLSYYSITRGLGFVDILRVVVRACLMPFFNVAASISNDAALLMERLSPLLVLIAPMGYGVGYAQGLRTREKVNTSIRIGVDKKRKKQRKEHKARMAKQPKKPEQLV